MHTCPGLSGKNDTFPFPDFFQVANVHHEPSVPMTNVKAITATRDTVQTMFLVVVTLVVWDEGDKVLAELYIVILFEPVVIELLPFLIRIRDPAVCEDSLMTRRVRGMY